MGDVNVIRNQDIKRVLIGTPKDHKHSRICIELKNGTYLVFQEATITSILRAYVTIKTHAYIRAQELEMKIANLEQLKKDFTEQQLLETSKTYEKIEEEMGNLLQASI